MRPLADRIGDGPVCFNVTIKNFRAFIVIGHHCKESIGHSLFLIDGHNRQAIINHISFLSLDPDVYGPHHLPPPTDIKNIGLC